MKTDFLGTKLSFDKCMACEIASENYKPPGGGILYKDEYFIIHQDPYVAIPGFLIISPKRHIYTIDEMTLLELYDMGKLIAIAENSVRKLPGVEYITIIQEEKVSEGHLHIWIFPWHRFILSQYEHSIENVRTITEHYRYNSQYQQETLIAAERVKKSIQCQNPNNSDHNYSGLFLCDQDFSNKDLSHANFSGAILKRCKFEGSDLSYANFDNADLYRSSFCGAKVYSTTFRGADLTRANFENSYLYGIKIFGADLSHTIFDKTVQEEKEGDFAKAEDIYNTIKRGYTENGNKEEAAKYYYKQCVCKRKQKRGLIRFFNWLIADLLIGYGERLTRCLSICAIVIFLFGGLYLLLSGSVDIFGCLFSSLSLFFGFDPIAPCSNMEYLKTLYSCEQIIGYFFNALALIGVARKIVRD